MNRFYRSLSIQEQKTEPKNSDTSKSTLEWLRVLISWKIFKTRKEKLNAWHPKVCTNIDNFLTQRLKRKMNLTMNHHLGLYTSCSR